MRFKLDENLDVRLVPLVEEGGHDIDTIRSEDLSGSTDDVVYETCIRTGRALITMDLDFSNPVRFPPDQPLGSLLFGRIGLFSRKSEQPLSPPFLI